MVTTRSAEKRLIAAGKTEDLAVRPKQHEPPATPTPSAPTNIKRNHISVDIPRFHESTNIADTNSSETRIVEGDDESPYATAKESPGSYLDAESLLVDQSIGSTPQLPSSTARPSTSSRKRKALFESVAHMSSSPDPARIVKTRSNSDQQTSSTTTQHDQPDLSGNIEQTTPSADERPVPEVTNNQPDTVTPVVQDSKAQGTQNQDQPVIISTPRDLFKVPQKHNTSDVSEASSIRTDSFATNSSRTIIGDTGKQATHRTFSLPRSFTSNNSHRLHATKLPDRPRNTLEAFRQQVMNVRVASHGKRSRGFKVTDDWSSKRRKFVMT